MWPDDSDVVSRSLDALIEMKKNGSKIGNSIPQLEAFKAYFSDPARSIKQNGCHLGQDAFNVNAIGDAYLCFFMEKLGNIKEASPSALWYSEAADRIREKIKKCRKNCELLVNCYYE